MFSFRRIAVFALRSRCVRSKHTLPELPYSYEELEPVISRDIMNLHHTKHHQAYVTNLNVAETKLCQAFEKGDISAIISLQPALKFNGGGHINHSIFWKNLSPCKTEPSLDFCAALKAEFGSLDKFKEQLSALAVGIQGSGWAWLAFNPKSKRLTLKGCANQDPLEATTGLKPLLGIDVWEHAYYLQYKNSRVDYVKAIYDIVNWKDVSERYEMAKC